MLRTLILVTFPLPIAFITYGLYRRYSGINRRPQENHQSTQADKDPALLAAFTTLNAAYGPGYTTGLAARCSRAFIIDMAKRVREVLGVSTTDETVEPEQPQLEVVHEDSTILAHRAAGFDLAHAIPFTTTQAWRNRDPIPLALLDESYCVSTYKLGGPEDHETPGVGCTCGFYALPPDLPPTFHDKKYVNLIVELGGTIIEHEKGYRAQYQSIIECQLFPCMWCGNKSEGVLVDESGRLMQASCIRHKDRYRKVYTRTYKDETTTTNVVAFWVPIDELATRLPVPVTARESWT